MLEEHGPELKHLAGDKNIVADMLSRLDLIPEEEAHSLEVLALQQEEKEELASDFPIRFARIAKAQLKDKRLQEKARGKNSKLSMKDFHGGGKTFRLLTYKDKIVIPAELQQQTIEWYHNTLLHPGANRTEKTIRQNFTFKNLTKKVEETCQKCHTCQLTKRLNLKYGKLPEKEAEATHGTRFV